MNKESAFPETGMQADSWGKDALWLDGGVCFLYLRPRFQDTTGPMRGSISAVGQLYATGYDHGTAL